MTRHLLRTVLFRIHWLLGIVAGAVLIVVGVTGGMLSFEDELLRAMNPGVASVQARGEPLSTAALLTRVAAQRPDDAIASLTRSADPTDPVVVGFAPKADTAPGPGGRARGESRRVDPYDHHMPDSAITTYTGSSHVATTVCSCHSSVRPRLRRLIASHAFGLCQRRFGQRR